MLLMTVGFAALGMAPAVAADLAPRTFTKAPAVPAPIATWNGFYVGFQGGGGWGTSKETFNVPNSAGRDFTQNYDISGGFVGGVAGYNWQMGTLVLGIEGDYHWADITGRSGVINVGPPNLGDTYFTKLRGFGDIKGRLGYAAGPALFFVSGGATVGDIQHRYDAALNGGAGNTRSSRTTHAGVGPSAREPNICSPRIGRQRSNTTTSISAKVRFSLPPTVPSGTTPSTRSRQA
jgi:outer membrane immunogenic protein